MNNVGSTTMILLPSVFLLLQAQIMRGGRGDVNLPKTRHHAAEEEHVVALDK